jgi:hypothetical protein
MKKLLFVLFIFLFTISLTAQDEFETDGWEVPADTSQYYGIYIFRIGSNPGGYLNWNWFKLDSLLNAGVVLTDTSQLYIRNDTLIISDYASGMAAFTTTDSLDTLVISGIDSLDVFLINAREANPLGAIWGEIVADTVFVNRADSTVSGLKYNWMWVRKYQ